jgi:2'-5' RNA ligase
MRLFFAIELPDYVQAALGELRLADSPAYRWVAPQTLHITLAFLGEQPMDRLEALRAAGRLAAEEGRPGVLRVGHAGSFGARQAPSVLWVGLDGEVTALTMLQARLAARLRAIGITLEDRAFSPHITLARRRASAGRGGETPAWPPQPPRPQDAVDFKMHALTLFESRLSPRGATYLKQFEFPLGQSHPG